MKIKTKQRLMLAASGLLTGFSVILPELFGALAWVSLIPALLVLYRISDREEIKLREFYAKGLLFYFAFASVYFHWFIALYPLDFTGLDAFSSVLVVIVAWFGLALMQALGGGVVFLISGAFAKIGAYRRAPWLKIILFPLVFILYEWFLTVGFWGVPWGRLALSQSAALPILQTASLFGSYFVSAVIIAVNALIAYAVAFQRKSTERRLFAFLALAIFCFNLALGSLLFGIGKVRYEDSEKITVAAVQGNNSISGLLVSKGSFDNYIRLTEQAAEAGAQLIVWPETVFVSELKPESASGVRISEVAKKYGVHIVVGAMKYEGDESYNCTFFIDSDGNYCEEVYKKRHLVPFGEYMPMREVFTFFLPFLGEITILDREMTPGEETAVYDAEGIGKLGSIICFDSIFETLTLDSVRDGAELIVLGTNDSWFKDSVGIYMHRNQARLRSIEVGRCTVRAACTGVSSIINNVGENFDEVAVFEKDFAVGEVFATDTDTLYTVIGNLFVYLSAAAVVLLFCFELYRDKKRPKKDE